MNGHVAVTDLCCLCELPGYSLRRVRNGIGSRWVTIEVTDRPVPVTWLVACAPCLATEWNAMWGSIDLADMPRTYFHDKIKQFEQRLGKYFKDQLVRKGLIEAADVDDIAKVQLRRELKDYELDEIRATREL